MKLDRIDLFLLITFGLGLIAIASVISIDISYRKHCENKGGAYVHGECFKGELFLKD